MGSNNTYHVYVPTIEHLLSSSDDWKKYVGTEQERLVFLDYVQQWRKGNYFYFSTHDFQKIPNLYRERPISDTARYVHTSAAVINSMGPLGHLLLSADNLSQAFDYIERYISTTVSFVEFNLKRCKDFIRVEVLPAPDIPDYFAARAVLRCLFIGDAFYGLITKKSGDLSMSVELTSPFTEKLSQLFNPDVYQCRFDQTVNAIVVPVEWASRPLPMASKNAQQKAEAECQQLLQELQQNMQFTTKVKQLLLNWEKPYPSIERIATSLHLTSRTVQRRLKDEGTSFRELLNDVKVEKSIEYILIKKYTITEAAYKVGFNDASSYTKAFKRSKGVTPSLFINGEEYLK